MEKNVINREKMLAKVQWCKQLSCVLDKILKMYEVEKECVDCKAGDPLFKTTCDYVDLRHEIYELKETLSNQAKYMEMIIDSDI